MKKLGYKDVDIGNESLHFSGSELYNIPKECGVET
jgi:hypothetical protein